MKTKYSLLTGLAAFAISAAFGQVEHDDMYFNSKDRAKLTASKEMVLAKQYKQQDIQAVKTSPINPTDSYSGRSVNPEYTNRLKTNPDLANTDSHYFVSGYQPVSVNQNLASNTCNCSTNNYNNFNNPSYNGYSSYGMNQGWGSPYSSFYSPWGMSSGYQSFQPGWSSMLGYSFGGMSSGWFGGMNYGYGNSWGSPWSNYGYGGGYFPYNSSGYGMQYGSGYGSIYNGTPVVINNNIDSRNATVYSKRANRSSDTDNLIDHTRPETGYTRTGREVATGRSRSENQSQYYDRGWKRDPEKNPSRSFWSDNASSTNSGSRSQSSSNWSNNTWGNSNSSGRQSSSDWSNNSSRSSLSSSDSGSRSLSSGSSSGASSGGGSRSRGRD